MGWSQAQSRVAGGCVVVGDLIQTGWCFAVVSLLLSRPAFPVAGITVPHIAHKGGSCWFA